MALFGAKKNKNNSESEKAEQLNIEEIRIQQERLLLLIQQTIDEMELKTEKG